MHAIFVHWKYIFDIESFAVYCYFLLLTCFYGLRNCKKCLVQSNEKSSFSEYCYKSFSLFMFIMSDTTYFYKNSKQYDSMLHIPFNKCFINFHMNNKIPLSDILFCRMYQIPITNNSIGIFQDHPAILMTKRLFDSVAYNPSWKLYQFISKIDIKFCPSCLHFQKFPVKVSLFTFLLYFLVMIRYIYVIILFSMENSYWFLS